LLSDLGEALAEDDDAVPLGLLPSLAGVLVPPRLRRRHPQIDNRTAVLGTADLRVSAQIADQNDLVDAACHDALRVAICADRFA